MRVRFPPIAGAPVALGLPSDARPANTARIRGATTYATFGLLRNPRAVVPTWLNLVHTLWPRDERECVA